MVSPLVEHVSGLRISQGQGAGEPFVVLPWERRFLRLFERTEGDLALSVSRGNGKTTLVAAIADAFLRGPLRLPRAECIVVASSFAQARISFDHLASFGGYRDDSGQRGRWRIWDSSNAALIECRLTGAKVRCIGSDPRRAHGLAPVLVLADEPAQWQTTQRDAMMAALRTGLGKIPGGRLVMLGTRPAEDDHFFTAALRQPGSLCYSARPSDPIGHRRTWARGNPSLDFMPALAAAIRREAEAAKRDPSLLASFRALRLNLGVSDVLEALLLEAGTWERIEGQEVSDQYEGPYILGIDLGQTAAMSAAAAYWPESGGLDAVACFPETPGLKERGLQDGVGGRYEAMRERSELLIAGRRVSDPAALLAEVWDRWGSPACIVADRWRQGELVQSLEKAAVPRVPIVWRGMGFKDGGDDVRRFRAACLGGRVTPRPSLLLRSCIGGARVVGDPAGNFKLAKGGQGKVSTHRDDAAAAAILTVAEGERRRRAAPKKRRRVVLVG